MSNQNKTLFGIIGLAVVGVVAYSSAFVVREGQQALITQFGRIVGEPITEAGLKWKLPLIQEVRYFDKRILEWDGEPNSIPTLEKKFIWVDTTARWKINDLVKFAQKLRTESQAMDRLNSILDGASRLVISKHNLVEAVRDSNSILDSINVRKKEKAAMLAELKRAEEAGEAPDLKAKLKSVELEEEILAEIEPVKVGREKLSQLIVERARKDLDALGIELIDVQLRRIAYSKSVEEKVYDRMISERKRIAEKYRSVGKGEMAKIQGKLDRDLKEIESNAYRKSQIISGKGEAEATAIYAQAMGQDKDFYKFTRSLEAYKKTLKDKSNLILSTDSDFLRYLK